jgi:hypothetical protein
MKRQDTSEKDFTTVIERERRTLAASAVSRLLYRFIRALLLSTSAPCVLSYHPGNSVLVPFCPPVLLKSFTWE